MTKIFFGFVTTLICLSCHGQRNVKVNIQNKSSQPIDSIVIPYFKIRTESAIERGEKKSIVVDLTNVKLQNEGSFDIYFFLKGKKFSGTFGSHFYGELDREDNLYVFDNGLSLNDSVLLPPKEFNLILNDNSDTPYDSITAKPGSLLRTYDRTEYKVLVLDFTKFSEDPVLFLNRGNSKSSVRINIDFSNWNVSQEFVTVKDGEAKFTYK